MWQQFQDVTQQTAIEPACEPACEHHFQCAMRLFSIIIDDGPWNVAIKKHSLAESQL